MKKRADFQQKRQVEVPYPEGTVSVSELWLCVGISKLLAKIRKL